jgi:hypothetical protein
MPHLRGYAWLFVALTFIYHSNLRPVAAGDSLPAALVPFSVLLDHSVTLDRFGPWIQQHVPYAPQVLRTHGGHWYSVYPVAGPVLTAPLYLPLLAVPGIRALPPETLIALARIAEKFAAVTLAALSAVWMLALLRRLTSPGWAWALVWMFALGTGAWSTSSQALWQHTFGQVAIVACLYELDRGRLWRCGAWAGLALLIRPTNLLLPVALAAALWSEGARPRDFGRLLAPVAAAGALGAAYNWFALGSLAGGYPVLLDGNFFGGLAGLLASPGRGLLLYTPVACFALACLAPAARAGLRTHGAVAVAAASFGVLHILAIALWPKWWGGYCWGPRLLTEILPGMTILVALGTPALATRRARVLFAAVAAYGLAIQALGVYFYPKGHWDNQPVSVDAAPARLWDWADNPIVRTARGGPAWEPYDLAITAIRQGPRAAQKRMAEIGIAGY